MHPSLKGIIAIILLILAVNIIKIEPKVIKSDSMNHISGSERKFTEFEFIQQSPEVRVERISMPDLIRRMTSEAGYSNYEQYIWLKIAEGESTFNPSAKGYAGEYYGLYQIYIGTWNYNNCEGDIFNPVDNIRCAIRIQRKSGFTPWEVYTKGI